MIGSLAKILSKEVVKATTKGQTRKVNKLIKLVENPDAVANRLKQIEAKQAEYGDTPVDVDIHRTGSVDEINEGNFNYRAGSTPAATGRGEGIFTSPTSYVDQNAAYGPRELGVVTERADSPKLGQGTTRLAMDGPDTPETFIPKNQVQEIFDITPAEPTLTPIGDAVVGTLGTAARNFKGSMDTFRSSNEIKKLFQDENISDDNILGMFVDSLRVIDENVAGQTTKVGSHGKVYERVSMQDLYDKVGRKVEARLMQGKSDRWSPAKRREVGGTIVNYTRGNLGDLIEEQAVKTKTGKGLKVKDEILLTTNDAFNKWAKSGGRTLMDVLDGPREARSPAGQHHGDWVLDAEGNILSAPKGSTIVDFFSGGSKSELSESAFPSVIDSLNILGRQKTGMDRDFFELNKTLGKNGLLKERAGPMVEHRDSLDMHKLTDVERDELDIAFNLIGKKIKDTHGDKKISAGEYFAIKEEVMTPRLKALENIAGDVKTMKGQYKAKQGAARRIDTELEKRFANDPEGKVFMQYNVDTRGRTSPIDPSGATLNSGGAIRHGFTGSTKPIAYGDEGFNQIIDDLVLFDDLASLSKIQATGLERHAHWLKNKTTYLKQGQEALDNVNNPDWKPTWLKGRKDTGPYLRSVMEVARIKNAADNGKAYDSNMMIEVDAPSSGSQHIGAQYGDEAILRQTSVLTDPVDATGLSPAQLKQLSEGVPDDAIARDLYTDVGVKYQKSLNKGYEDLAKTDPEKAELFSTVSGEFLSSGRGIVKPVVMKVPYGAGDDTLRLDLVTQLDGRQQLELVNRGVDPEELMNFHWSHMQGALKEGLATQYEFKQFNSVLGGIYNKATSRTPFLVEGPTGDMTDLTRYVMGSKKTFQSIIPPERVPDISANKPAHYRGQEVTVYNAVPVEDFTSAGVNKIKIDSQMISQGMAPNVTHMMDAGYLHKLVKAAAAMDIEVRVVHDAFFVHPNDVKAVKQLAGKVFQDVHANYNLRQKMIEGLSKATGQSIDSIKAQIQKSGLTLETGFDIGAQPVEAFTNVVRGG